MPLLSHLNIIQVDGNLHAPGDQRNHLRSWGFEGSLKEHMLSTYCVLRRHWRMGVTLWLIMDTSR